MPSGFDIFEIELFCSDCGEEFVVLGKVLTRSPEAPCPACGEIVRVDVWSFHAQWMRMQKSLGKF